MPCQILTGLLWADEKHHITRIHLTTVFHNINHYWTRSSNTTVSPNDCNRGNLNKPGGVLWKASAERGESPATGTAQPKTHQADRRGSSSLPLKEISHSCVNQGGLFQRNSPSHYKGGGEQEKLRTMLGGTELTTNFQRTFTGMDKSRTQERRPAYENEQFNGIVHQNKWQLRQLQYAEVKIFCE